MILSPLLVNKKFYVIDKKFYIVNHVYHDNRLSSYQQQNTCYLRKIIRNKYKTSVNNTCETIFEQYIAN